MVRRLSSALLGAAFVAGVAAPAHALNARTWISGKGIDQGGCGPIASPCRTLQYAHDNTTSGGEIDVLDGAGYGSLVITKAINVVNDGAGVAGALGPANGVAIVVNAGGSDAVVLRGLSIEGAGSAVTGVYVVNAGTVLIDKCLVQNFTSGGASLFQGVGIAIDTRSPFRYTIHDTVIANNRDAGVQVNPEGSSAQTQGVIDHVVSHNNNTGFYIVGNSAQNVVTISNSVASVNSVGISLNGKSGQMDVTIDDTRVAGNTGEGIIANAAGIYVFINRSVVTGNYIGIDNQTSGSFYTMGNNQVRGNTGQDLGGTPLNTSLPPQ